MATWPATLPGPVLDGYALDPIDQTIRTDMEFGAARTRRRSTAQNDKLAVSWIFTRAQMAAFRIWFADSAQAAGGSAWFDIVVDTGEGASASQTCKFAGPWKGSLRGGGIWSVTATLEVR
jgi:hypothetical protein